MANKTGKNMIEHTVKGKEDEKLFLYGLGSIVGHIAHYV